MKTRFTKMHGAGNDFVVFDAVRQSIALNPQRIARLAARHQGIGCDQVLVVEPPQSPEIDFTYRIYNSDGAEVEQCGNGARAFVRFVIDQGLTQKRTIRVATAAGVITPSLQNDGSVRVDMGAPRFAAAAVPFDATDLVIATNGLAPTYRLTLGNQTFELCVVSMGNPHAVLHVEDVSLAAVDTLGPLLEHHARFVDRVNVGFMQRLDAQHIALRVFERGAGETLSCGTGACAAVAVGIARGELQSPVQVDTRGGTLVVEWSGADGQAVFLSGPATTVFEGEIDLALLD